MPTVIEIFNNIFFFFQLMTKDLYYKIMTKSEGANLFMVSKTIFSKNKNGSYYLLLLLYFLTY